MRYQYGIWGKDPVDNVWKFRFHTPHGLQVVPFGNDDLLILLDRLGADGWLLCDTNNLEFDNATELVFARPY